MIGLVITCPVCGHRHEVYVTVAEYEKYQNGELIQKAMPNLTPTEREQIISGLCATCQARIFGE